ncbi:flagellin [Pseudomonadota bacterium]
MAMVINTNIMSLNAQRNLSKSSQGMEVAMQRLSSGLRINSAKDDAAGLAITDRMTSQIRGLNQAVRNANDGISLAQVAEGSMAESSNILQRMRELAIQSANDSNSDADRANIQKEVTQLQEELNRIADTTTFNGRNVIDGSFSAAKFHVGAFADETISVAIGSARATDMGANTVSSSNTNFSIGASTGTAGTLVDLATTAEVLTLNGTAGLSNVNYAVADSAKDLADAVNEVSGTTGVSASASTSLSITAGANMTEGTVQMTLGSYDDAATAEGTPTLISAVILDTGDLSGLADAINKEAASTGITAELSSDLTSITLTQDKGYSIGISGVTDNDGATDAAVMDVSYYTGGATTTVSLDDTTANAGVTNVLVGGRVEFTSKDNFLIGSDGTNILDGVNAAASSLSSVADADVSTQVNANAALKVIDSALAFIADNRADLGAIQNRLESTISNLSSVSENVSAARSRVLDADFAAETAAMTRSQILQQAGVAMLSQANSQPQTVLSLLQ